MKATTNINFGKNSTSLKKVVILIVLIVIGALLPSLTKDSPFILVLASHALIAGALALSLDILTGSVGLLTFGHAAWFGYGAYATGLMAKSLSSEMTVVLPLTALTALLLATAIGAILVRQIGKTFAILTLALSQIMFAAVFVFSKVTGGEDGLQGIPMPTLLGFAVKESQSWFWVLYAFLLASLMAALYVRNAPMGKSCLAIRENGERSRFIGIKVWRVKLQTYAVSSALAAVTGGLHALYTGSAAPDMLHWTKSGEILMYAVLGGMGTLTGPVFGGIVFTVAEHYVSSWTDAWQIYFGGLFVIMVIVAPGGLFGAFESIKKRFAGNR
ncbi:MAG: branched-chain amino acid ABC transporter permease [Anaerolineales bacterium]|nr:branched-chain amino acid ABC transporter permease [Rhodocyclaceae bacterium]MCW5886697.1 branched-chain amino acid ABC transporter permease [Anaerolineales bacterium]